MVRSPALWDKGQEKITKEECRILYNLRGPQKATEYLLEWTEVVTALLDRRPRPNSAVTTAVYSLSVTK